MESIWIIGAGQFGRAGAHRLLRKRKDCRLTLVDLVSSKLDQLGDLVCERVHADGIAFMSDRFDKGELPDWIVPAVPVHLAWEWCRHAIGSDQVKRVIIPAALDHLLPNPMRGTDGHIYVSLADFMCPEDCIEPKGRCTVTKARRTQVLYERLTDVRFQDFEPAVIRSHQLGPGVGGYRAADLLGLQDRLKSGSGRFIIGTACSCHGVLTGVKRMMSI